MDFTTFFLVLCTLQLLCSIVARRACQSKALKSQEDYFLAGKSVRTFPLAMTFIATQIGGGIILGSADEAYRFGFIVFLYPLGIGLGFLFLSLGIGKKLAQFQVSTISQLLEQVYRSRQLKYIAAVLSILALFMILVAQVIASRQFLLTLGVERLDLFIAFWAIAILYTTTRGLFGIIAVDIIQAGFFLGVFALSFFSLFYLGDFSPQELIAQGSAMPADFSKSAGWLLMPLLFMAIEQDMAQRCFAATTPRAVSKAAAWSAAVTVLIGVIPISFGLAAKLKDIPIAAGSSTLMSAVQLLLTPQLAALVGCAVLMAIVSTAVSLINSISSNITQDFALGARLPRIGRLRLSRYITMVIGLAAIFCSFFFQGVVDVLIQSYELSVSCFFVPVIAALFSTKAERRGAYLALIFGAVGFIGFRFVPLPFPKEIASLALSSTGYAIGYLMAQRVAKASVQIEQGGQL